MRRHELRHEAKHDRNTTHDTRPVEAEGNDERPRRIRGPGTGDDLRLLTIKATAKASRVEKPQFGELLELLDSYEPDPADPEAWRGATYRTLTACACEVGLMGEENLRCRSRWYVIAKSVPLTEQMACHMLYTLAPWKASASAARTGWRDGSGELEYFEEVAM